MFRKIRAVRAEVWLLLVAVCVAIVIPLGLQLYGVISPQDFLYVAQPVAAVALIGLTYLIAGHQVDRVRNKTEGALVVGSVLAIWFVVYFLSGLTVTYIHNAFVSSLQSVLTNSFAFGIVAVAFEYARHHVLLLAGRRNMSWFGVVVAVLFSLQQMHLLGFMTPESPDELVKFITSDTVPALANSLLLTYLCIRAGFASQLTYRLGLLAIAILPPIIPKYDWYMLGASAILVAVIVYVVIDRSRQSREVTRSNQRLHHPAKALDIMYSAILVALILFMTGAFSYKPLVIMSNSMVPVFDKGSMVVVQKVASPMDIRVGDIIQYEGDTKMITHRVVAIDDELGGGERIFTTKGDNSPSIDPPVEGSHVVGVIRSSIPYVGYPTVWLKEMSKK